MFGNMHSGFGPEPVGSIHALVGALKMRQAARPNRQVVLAIDGDYACIGLAPATDLIQLDGRVLTLADERRIDHQLQTAEEAVLTEVGNG